MAVNPALWYTTFQDANRPGSPMSAMQPGVAYQRPIQQATDPMEAAFAQKPNPMQMALAKQMMATGSSTAPVRSPLEGLARTLTGVAGGYFAGEANERQQAFDAAKTGRLASLLGMTPEEAEGLSSAELLAVGEIGKGQREATAKATAAQAKAAADQAKESFSQEKNIRKEYSDLSKPFRDIRSNYKRVISSAEKPSKAGDIALIFSFMKSLDPASTVREGEFATARDAGSISESVIATYNSLIKGDAMLAPSVRRDFVDRATRLYSAALDSQQGLEEEYGGLAREYDLDANRVLPDYVRGLEPVNLDEFMPVDPGQTTVTVPTDDGDMTGGPNISPDEFTDEKTGITYVLDPDQGRYVRKK